MGTDNRAEFTISFEGDAGGISTFMNAFKRSLKSDVAEIENATNGIQLFRNLKGDLDKAAAAVTSTTANLAKLKDQVVQVQSAGESVGKDLAKGLKDAEKAANTATREFDKQTTAVARMATTLKAAGVDTSRLATEEIRLATSLKLAQAAEAERQAGAVLGIKLTRDHAAELAKANAAFQLLRASGNATAIDLTNAQKGLVAKQQEFNASVIQSGGASSALGASLKSAFVGAVLPLVGITAVIAALSAGVHASVEAAKEWRNEVAKIATVTNTTDAEVTALTDGVRKLSREMGFSAVEGIKALYDILRSGVPSENALAVLAVSADAAKASLTDIGTATKLATTLTKSYGIATADLTGVFDIFFAAQKRGGPTIAELATSLGEIAPIAKATNTPVSELSAALQTMVQGGVDASSAINILGKILTNLDKPEVIKSLHEAGIEVNGLVGTLEQIKAKGLSLDQVLGLGVGNEKSIKGLLALTNAGSNLAKNLDDAAHAAGSLKDATDKLDKTPQERMEKFSAAVKDVQINMGDQIVRASFLTKALTDLANKYNGASEQSKKLRDEFGLTNTIVPTTYDELSRTLQAYAVQLGLAREGQAKLREDFVALAAPAVNTANAIREAIAGMLTDVTAKVDAAAKRVTDITKSLQFFADDLAKQREAGQKLTQQDITDLNTRTAAQIAGLNALRDGEIASAKALLKIQTDTAADRLAIIVKSAADAKATLDAQYAAELKLAGDNAEQRKKLEKDILAARLASIAPIRDALQKSYDDLLSIARGHAAKLADIERQRVALNQSIQDQIRGIWRESLGAFEQYQDKLLQIEQLKSQARAELAKGDQANLNTVEDLANRARQLVSDVGKEVTQGGKVVVTATEAQTTAIGELNDIGEILNTTLDRRAAAERAGITAANEAAAKVKGALDGVNKQYDDFLNKVDDGITLKINEDVQGIKEALDKIDAAIAERERLIPVQLDLKDALSQVDALLSDVTKGITEGLEARITLMINSLNNAVDKAPEITLKTDKIEGQIDTLSVQINALSNLAPEIHVAVESNVDDVTAKFNALNGKTVTSYHNIIETTTQAKAGGGPVGEFVRAFHRGGMARNTAGAQRLATGGPVFRIPPWLKVPGTGSGDTVPAALTAGSFVVRKAASQHYGDGLMSALARGAGPQRFAFGGGVLGDMASRFFGATRGGTNLGGFSLDPELGATIDEAYRIIYPLFSDSKALPRSSTGQDLSDFLSIVLGMIRNAESAEDAHRLFDPIRDSVSALEASIANAARFHLPIAMGTFTSGDDTSKLSKVSDLYERLSRELRERRRFLFAGGGIGGTDSVPAMLTPGEFVIREPVARRLGPGLLHAVNRMAIPPGLLANMMAPPMPISRFAEGGQVGSSSLAFAGGAPGAGVERGITVNFPIDGNDLLSDALINKRIIPAIERALIKAGVLPR